MMVCGSKLFLLSIVFIGMTLIGKHAFDSLIRYIKLVHDRGFTFGCIFGWDQLYYLFWCDLEFGWFDFG